jgi:hypothetical protein
MTKEQLAAPISKMETTTINIEQERVRFEKWLSSTYPRFCNDNECWNELVGDQYNYAVVRSRFDGWLAAKQDKNNETE